MCSRCRCHTLVLDLLFQQALLQGPPFLSWGYSFIHGPLQVVLPVHPSQHPPREAWSFLKSQRIYRYRLQQPSLQAINDSAAHSRDWWWSQEILFSFNKGEIVLQKLRNGEWNLPQLVPVNNKPHRSFITRILRIDLVQILCTKCSGKDI